MEKNWAQWPRQESVCQVKLIGQRQASLRAHLETKELCFVKESGSAEGAAENKLEKKAGADEGPCRPT